MAGLDECGTVTADATIRTMRTYATPLAALVLLLPAGCASVPTPSCAAGEQAMTGETLYFGTQAPDGTVSPQQWSEFLASVVTPRFPQGLSV